MSAICQRCNKEQDAWQLRQAAFDCGLVKGWKLQLCAECTVVVQTILLTTLSTCAPSVEKPDVV